MIIELIQYISKYCGKNNYLDMPLGRIKLGCECMQIEM